MTFLRLRLVSDKEQVLCKPSALYTAFLIGFGVGAVFAALVFAGSPRQFSPPPSGLPAPANLNLSRFEGFPLRSIQSAQEEPLVSPLQKVVHRRPVPFQPHASEPGYLLIEFPAAGNSQKKAA